MPDDVTIQPITVTYQLAIPATPVLAVGPVHANPTGEAIPVEIDGQPYWYARLDGALVLIPRAA